MKHLTFFLILSVTIIACQRNKEIIQPANELQSLSARDGSSGSGSGGSTSGGGSTTTTGLLQSVLSGTASRLIGGNTDSFWVSFTQLTPAGLTLRITSSDPATLQVPATYTVPAGVYSVQPRVTSVNVAAAKFVTITVTLGSETKSTTLKIFPRTYTFPPPQLQSPGNGAGFKNRIQVKFTWSDNVNAYYHDIQISDDPTFSNTPMLEVYLNDPIWAASYFNGLGRRYWRVRYIDASGNFGPWSAVRNFEIKS